MMVKMQGQIETMGFYEDFGGEDEGFVKQP